MKFDFSKSVDTDFRNKLQSDLQLINKNVLYLTYQIDWIRKYINQQIVDKGLQKQVDQYFDDDKSEYQEECTDDGPSKKDLD